MTKPAALLLLFALSACSSARAQRSLGYWFIAPGALTARAHSDFTLHMGGGGELALPKGFSAGIEAGALGPTHNYSDNVLGVASLNGYYHFRHSRSAVVDPFVTAGYSLFFRHGTNNLANFGGGLNYWIWRGVGVRTEFRDHVYTGGGPTLHFWNFRFGLSFTEFSP